MSIYLSTQPVQVVTNAAWVEVPFVDTPVFIADGDYFLWLGPDPNLSATADVDAMPLTHYAGFDWRDTFLTRTTKIWVKAASVDINLYVIA